MATLGRLPLPANPLKTTTVEIYHGWQEELAQLQRRWNEIKANAQAEREEGTEEAEGLRLRLQSLRDLIAEAEVVGGDPSSWRTEVPLVRLGSMVSLEFEDETTDEFLFVGLAGPTVDTNVVTPKTPLGAAILGRKVGESIAYKVGQDECQVLVRRCLVPGHEASAPAESGVGKILTLVGKDEQDEAQQVAMAVDALLRKGTPASEVAVAWRAPYQSLPFETAFVAGGIRFRLEGAENFYEQPAVRGIVALLRLFVDPAQGKALFNVLRTFTHAPVEALEHLAAEWTGPEQATLPPPMAKDKGAALILQVLREAVPRANDLSPAEALMEFGRRLGRLRPDLVREGFYAPWSTLLRAAAPHKRIRSFLAHADEIAAKSHRSPRDGVVLTPLALLGGRKFNALYLVGVNEGAIPFLAPGEPGSLPDERELFYGALTAAKYATISWARTIGGKPAKRSRFLAEVAATWELEGAFME